MTDATLGVVRRLNPWRLAIGTVALTALLALGVLGMMTPFWLAPVEAQVSRLVEFAGLALVMVVAVAAADEAADRGLPRAAVYAAAVAGGALAGALLGWEVQHALGFGPPPGSPHRLSSSDPWVHRLDLAVIGTLVGGLATFVHVNRRTALAARRRQHEAERARAAAQRRTLESRLQALQARVEPVFLFDTLERIRNLYRSDPAAGGAMLQDLIAYLRAVLPHLRESSSTADREAVLARTWLDILARSAPGWRVGLHVGDSARHARVPALVVLPLVQQAVAAPGDALALTLSFRADGGRLHLDVWTSGDAFARGLHGRPVLAQIGERLRALHGERARLACGPVAGGSRASIELPLEFMEPDGGAT